MVLTKAPDGAAAISPWREQWELETNKTQARRGRQQMKLKNVLTLAATPSGVFPYSRSNPQLHRGLIAVATNRG